MRESDIQYVKKEIESIKARNTRVEANKAWEASWTRRITVSLATYLVVCIFFFYLGSPRPFIDAIVPVLGFLFSTLSVDIIKSWWLEKQYKIS